MPLHRSPFIAARAARAARAADVRVARVASPRHMDRLLTTLTPDTAEAEMLRADLEEELERLHAAAFGWALSCCAGDRAAAEDVLQASYLKILDGRARFDGRSSFRTWVFGVVRRTAAEERRRARLRRWLPLSGLAPGSEPADSRPDPETALARSELTQWLERALGGLTDRQREVLHLVFYQELTIAEAAEVLGVGLGTARTHYERGKAALRQRLEEDPG